MPVMAPDRFDVVFAACPNRRGARSCAAWPMAMRPCSNGPDPFSITPPPIPRHLKVLEHAGLITRGRDGQQRPCRLRPEPLAEIAAWAEHTRAACEGRLDRLDAHLRRTAARPATAPKPEKP